MMSTLIRTIFCFFSRRNYIKYISTTIAIYFNFILCFMKPHVLRCCQYNKVLYSIIIWYSVNMMNFLKFHKISIKMFLHQIPMVTNSSSIYSYHYIPATRFVWLPNIFYIWAKFVRFHFKITFSRTISRIYFIVFNSKPLLSVRFEIAKTIWTVVNFINYFRQFAYSSNSYILT